MRRRPAAIDLHQARPLALCARPLAGRNQSPAASALAARGGIGRGRARRHPRPGDEPHLAERLEAVIKGGAEAVGCQAAGLYLLDEAHVGAEAACRLGPARRSGCSRRPGRCAARWPIWKRWSATPSCWKTRRSCRTGAARRSIPSAVCVPVSSPTVPLGTLWVFSDQPRDFSPQETNLIEIVAGRLAADLEREMLLAAGTPPRPATSNSSRRPLARRSPAERRAAPRRLRSRRLDPPGRGSRRRLSRLVGSARRPAGLGRRRCRGPTARSGARVPRRCMRPSSPTPPIGTAPRSCSRRVNDSLLAASPGDQRASLAYALLDPEQRSPGTGSRRPRRSHLGLGRRAADHQGRRPAHRPRTGRRISGFETMLSPPATSGNPFQRRPLGARSRRLADRRSRHRFAPRQAFPRFRRLARGSPPPPASITMATPPTI